MHYGFPRTKRQRENLLIWNPCKSAATARYGRIARETLLRLRLDDYAAVGTEPSVFWSKLRMRAFREAIESAGCRCHLRTRRDRGLGAQRCGYRDNNHLKNLFKRTFSMSMRDYRCA